MKEDCVFCKIIKGEISSYKVYEDEFTLAFLDISNEGNGHILVIPKEHYENVVDCDSSVLAKVAETVKLVSKHLVENCGFGGVNIINASGKDAEQSVFHLHFHILPRKEGDQFSTWPSLPENSKSREEIFKEFSMIKD